MTLLHVKSLTKTYPPDTTAVSDVTLSIDEGEIVCLLGPSGCGKTTLLRLIAGLETPDRGAVRFAGEDMAATPPHRRDFGMMFQDFALFPHKNVFQNVAFGLQMRGDAPEAVQERVKEMLALVDLTSFGEREIAQLSGGEQQRVALARSLAPGPRLLLLDEPLGSLDRALRERLMVEVRGILKEVGVTAVYVTHDQEEAFAVADRVAVMEAGRIEQIDAPPAVYRRPATPFVARFLGFRNLLPGTVSGAHEVKTALGRFRVGDESELLSPDTAVTLLIRPDAADPCHPGERDDNELQGKIGGVAFRGRFYQVWVEVGEGTLLFEVTAVDGWEEGAEVTLRLSPAHLVALEGRVA